MKKIHTFYFFLPPSKKISQPLKKKKITYNLVILDRSDWINSCLDTKVQKGQRHRVRGGTLHASHISTKNIKEHPFWFFYTHSIT